DGYDDFVQVPDSDLWAFGDHDFTINLWANFDVIEPSTITHPQVVLIGNGEGPGSQNKWTFCFGAGQLYFHVNSPTEGPAFFAFAPFTPTIGQWYHLAVTRSASLYTIYVDGVPVGSEVNTRTIPNANAPLTIGQAESVPGTQVDLFMDGRIDEVQIYNRALASGEVASIAAAGSAGLLKQPLTTTTLAASENPAVYGQALTFTANVAAASSDQGTPTGSVQFLVDGANLGAAVTLVNGAATSPAANSLRAGNHTVTAIYSGDTNFIASVSTD